MITELPGMKDILTWLLKESVGLYVGWRRLDFDNVKSQDL